MSMIYDTLKEIGMSVMTPNLDSEEVEEFVIAPSLSHFVCQLQNEYPIKDNMFPVMFKQLVIDYTLLLIRKVDRGMFEPCVDGEPFNYSKHGLKEQHEAAKKKVIFEFGNDLKLDLDNMHLVHWKGVHLDLNGITVEKMIDWLNEHEENLYLLNK